MIWPKVTPLQKVQSDGTKKGLQAPWCDMAKVTEKRLRALEALPAARRNGAAKDEITPEQAGEIFDILASAGAIEQVMRSQMGEKAYEQASASQVPERT